MSWPIVIEKGSPKHRLWQLIGYALVAAAILWIAFRMENYQILNFANVAAYSVAILGLMVIIGYSGQISIGQSFFFGLGAYVTAYLGVDHNWNFLLTLPVSAALGFAVGFLIGIPALRIRGLYLALVTLALAAVFPVIAKFQALDSITGGANGKPADVIVWKTPGWTPGNLSNQAWQFLVLSAIGAVMFLLASNMMKSRPGRSLVALRDSEVGAAVSGVWPAGWKVGAFAISAAYGAIGGSMLVFVVRIAAPETGGFTTAIALLTGAVIGGLGTISGSVIGALVVTFVPYFTSDFMSGGGLLFIPSSDAPRHFWFFSEGDGPILASALYGVLLIAVVFVMPGGIAYFVRLVRAKLIRFVPKLPDVSTARGDERRLLRSLRPRERPISSRGENPHEESNSGPRRKRGPRADVRGRCVRRRQRLQLCDHCCSERGDDGGSGGDYGRGSGDHRRGERRGVVQGAHDGCPADVSTPLADGADIVLGMTVPLTGPLAAFGAIPQGMNAVFAKVNEAGGIDGHKVTLVAKDDAYDPTKTPPLATELVEKDHVLASVFQVGTPNVAATQGIFEAACTPQLFVATGFPNWGDPAEPPVDDRRHHALQRRIDHVGRVHRQGQARRQDRRAHLQQRLRQGVRDDDEAGRSRQGLHDRRQRAARGHGDVDRQRGHEHPRRQPRRGAR